MNVAAWTPEYLKIMGWIYDSDWINSFWDIASQNQKSGARLFGKIWYMMSTPSNDIVPNENEPGFTNIWHGYLHKNQQSAGRLTLFMIVFAITPAAIKQIKFHLPDTIINKISLFVDV